MTMPPRLRNLALATHLTVSTGWIGTVIAYLALGIAAATSNDAQTIRAAWIAMELTGWYAIVPLALASLLTGLVMALYTKWGLFRHYWVLYSFALTTLAVVALLTHMPDVSAMADRARTADADHLSGHGGDLVHASLGLAVLLVIQVLNIYKPQGMTRHGWRRQQREARQPQPKRGTPVP